MGFLTEHWRDRRAVMVLLEHYARLKSLYVAFFCLQLAFFLHFFKCSSFTLKKRRFAFIFPFEEVHRYLQACNLVVLFYYYIFSCVKDQAIASSY